MKILGEISRNHVQSILETDVPCGSQAIKYVKDIVRFFVCPFVAECIGHGVIASPKVTDSPFPHPLPSSRSQSSTDPGRRWPQLLGLFEAEVVFAAFTHLPVLFGDLLPEHS